MVFSSLLDDFQFIFKNNTSIDFLFAIGIFVLIYIVLYIFKKILIVRIKKIFEKHNAKKIGESIAKIFDKLGFVFYFTLPFYTALNYIVLPVFWETKILAPLLYLLFLYYVMIIIGIIIDIFIQKIIIKEEKNEEGLSSSMLIGLSFIVKIVLWILGILAILANLGVDITAFIAGLGIGGIAIAFALQGILGDLFASFSIFFDKPFKKGDFIIVGSDLGTVKHIGLRSTKIDSLRGEELIISNKELTSSRIHNFKGMPHRRVVFKIGIEYNTNLEKTKKAIDLMKEAISSTSNVKLDRVHFASYGDFSLNYECVYFVLNSDYNEYMDIQQDINLKIKESFERENIVFAFPTQTLFLKKEGLIKKSVIEVNFSS